ncbi:MAG: hypothetical protein U0P45_06660 [Acidimicrobiales bacterium]
MPTADDRPTDRRWLLVLLVVLLPVLVLIGVLAQRTWYPTGDQAQAELRMRSLPSHPPLVGAAGRIQDEQRRQGNHPGPLMFWATWPLYALLGRSSWAFEAATALVNVLWLGISVWLVKRRAGMGACAWYGITALLLIGATASTRSRSRGTRGSLPPSPCCCSRPGPPSRATGGCPCSRSSPRATRCRATSATSRS